MENKAIGRNTRFGYMECVRFGTVVGCKYMMKELPEKGGFFVCGFCWNYDII